MGADDCRLPAIVVPTPMLHLTRLSRAHSRAGEFVELRKQLLPFLGMFTCDTGGVLNRVLHFYQARKALTARSTTQASPCTWVDLLLFSSHQPASLVLRSMKISTTATAAVQQRLAAPSGSSSTWHTAGSAWNDRRAGGACGCCWLHVGCSTYVFLLLVVWFRRAQFSSPLPRCWRLRARTRWPISWRHRAPPARRSRFMSCVVSSFNLATMACRF